MEEYLIIDQVKNTGTRILRNCAFSIEGWLEWIGEREHSGYSAVIVKKDDYEFKPIALRSLKPEHIKKFFLGYLRHPFFSRPANLQYQYMFSGVTIDFIRKQLGIVHV